MSLTTTAIRSNTDLAHHVSPHGVVTDSQNALGFKLLPASPTGPTLLVIEDDQDLRWLLALIFTEKGYQVIQAEDGEEGLKTALTTPVDLILIDFDLPFIHGLEIVRQLRQHPRFEALPIIMMTCHGKAAYDSAVNAGCDEFLPKPIDFDRLYELLDYFAPLRTAQSV
jgi:DNA-binding response OmpR family regulator